MFGIRTVNQFETNQLVLASGQFNTHITPFPLLIMIPPMIPQQQHHGKYEEWNFNFSDTHIK